MTLKKSLISIVASAAIIATITGCSSDSTTTPPPTSGATPTTLTVADGYVVNYSVVATLNDGNTSTTATTTVACPNANTKASIAAGASQTAGTATLDLTQDLTDAQIANLEAVAINYAAQTTNGTTLTYGTFYDADADGKFVAANGDILVTDTTMAMSAPAGYSVVTPVTTLVNARLTTLTASDTNDTNRTAVEALALAQIAAGLGLSATDIQGVDPLTVATSNPTYTLINSMLGQAITDGDMTAIATSLATATAATDAVTALTNIAAGATTGAAYYTSAATQIAADSDVLTAVATMNLDGMRSQTAGGATTFTPTYLTPSAADFNVTAITMTTSGAATSALTGAGAKVNTADLNALQMAVTKADLNVSNKPLTVAIKIGSQEAYILDDANISSLTISIPYEINNTKTTGMAGTVSGDVSWEGITPAGAFFSGDMNSTYFLANTTTPFAIANPSVTTATLNMDIQNIITAIEANSTSAKIVANQISDVSVALVDHNASMQMTNAGSTASVYWGNTQVAATAGTINVTGKSILRNALLDGRAGGAVANSVPANVLTLTGGNGANGLAGNTLVFNDNSAITLAVGNDVGDAAEQNTTISFALSGTRAGDFDLNTSTLSAWTKANTRNTAAAGSEVNTTSTTAGDINVTLTTTITDEFGDSNSTAYSLAINRQVYVTGTAFSTDNNSSQFISDYDGTPALAAGTAIRIIDNGNTALYLAVGTANALEANLSSDNTDGNYTISLNPNGTLELNQTLTAQNITDLNFTITDINATDAYTYDFNTTEAVDGNSTTY